VYFAIDNVDIIEDTPLGHDTFHGTVVVICQRESDYATSFNGPLQIPVSATSKCNYEVKYFDSPKIWNNPRYEHYGSYNFNQASLLRYLNH